MAPSVAMPLWVEHLGISLIDGAGYVATLVTDVIVKRVGDFSAVDVAREVPDQPVVNRVSGDWRQTGIVSASQQGQLFFDQRGGLIHEAMDGSRFRSIDL